MTSLASLLMACSPVAAALVAWGAMRATLNGLKGVPAKVAEIAEGQAALKAEVVAIKDEVRYLRDRSIP